MVSYARSSLLALSSLTSLAFQSATAQSTDNVTTIDFNSCCSNAQEATAFAIAYGTPLVAYSNFSAALLKGIGGPNKLIYQGALSDPSVRNVVRPNADTVYTIGFMDLSQTDVVLTIPEFTDGRYWDYPFYDPFGDQFATLSSVTGAPAGEYLIRRADDASVLPGVEMTSNSQSCIPKYRGIVNFPTTYGTLLSRILVKQNTTADLKAVSDYQHATTLKTVSRTLSKPALPQAPQLTPELLDVGNINDPSQKALELTARMGMFNQPEVPADRYRIGEILGLAGITNSSYTPPAGVDLQQAQKVADATSTALIRTPSNLMIQTNGWVLQNTATQGDFKLDYATRYYIALNGYLQLNPQEALYPTYAAAQLVGTSLNKNQAYLFTFSGLPPTLPLPGTSGQQGGFWSLTAYAADQFLIPNSLGRYEVGDRSGLTYSDGTLVYPSANATTGVMSNLATTSMAFNATRPFQVLLQPADVAPPSNWTSNWLPGPPGGGNVIFLLRWYAPSSAFTDESYVYPLVEKVDAIV